jgi:hypothetical protein
VANAPNHADPENLAGHAARDAIVRDAPNAADAVNLAGYVKTDQGPALSVSLGNTEFR